MTAGSCSVAIRRRRPPQWAHGNTSIPNARCMRAAQLQARGLAVFTPVPSRPWARARADYLRAPPGARGQHAMANQQVGFGPRRHPRQTLRKLQRLEHQLPRAVVPRPRELQRDAAVAPPSQALLREGRTQDVAAQTFHSRPIVRRHPDVGVQVEPVQVRLHAALAPKPRHAVFQGLRRRLKPSCCRLNIVASGLKFGRCFNPGTTEPTSQWRVALSSRSCRC
jgi:hypothetical protein